MEEEDWEEELDYEGDEVEESWEEEPEEPLWPLSMGGPLEDEVEVVELKVVAVMGEEYELLLTVDGEKVYRCGDIYLFRDESDRLYATRSLKGLVRCLLRRARAIAEEILSEGMERAADESTEEWERVKRSVEWHRALLEKLPRSTIIVRGRGVEERFEAAELLAG